MVCVSHIFMKCSRNKIIERYRMENDSCVEVTYQGKLDNPRLDANLMVILLFGKDQFFYEDNATRSKMDETKRF